MIQTSLRDNNELIDTTYRLLEIEELRKYFKNFKLPWRFLEIDETFRILKDNNYKNIKVEPFNYKVEFDNLNKMIDFFKSAALIPFLSILPEEKHEFLVNSYIDRYFKNIGSNKLEVKMNRIFISAGKFV